MSGTLFDISPAEDQPKKKTKKSRAAESPAAAVAEKAFLVPAKPAAASTSALGVAEGFECLCDSCRCGIHDITEVSFGSWRLECWACGVAVWVDQLDDRFDRPAVQSVPAESPKEFVFDGGWAAGRTIQDVAAECGIETIRLMAEDRRNPGWSEPLKTWLAARGQTC